MAWTITEATGVPFTLFELKLVPGDPTKDLKAIETIAMVVKDGAVYFPAEVYPEFGIEPFAQAPKVTPAS